MVILRLIEERETEIEIEERKTEMEVRDCSLWHYLIFCEEFVSDACKNDFVCWVCKESVLGHPAFKCLECSFVQHKLCSNLPDPTKMDVKHKIRKRHHLLLREEMVNNGNEEAVCMGCGKLVSGPTYRCSIPQCTFHLHKSCDQLSHAIQHIRHPDHTLLLRLPSRTPFCNLCRRFRKKHPLFYGCHICNFKVDIKCLPRWDIIQNERKMELGDYSLWHYLIFCEEFVNDDVICWVCEEPVSGHPAFKCLECSFVQHKSCSNLPDLTRMDVKHKISKRHHLLLREEMVNNGNEEAVCMGCRKLVSGPTYRCSVPQCTFHLHKSCDQLSHAIQHFRHPDHTLFLRLPASYKSCDLCRKKRKKHRLLYGCRICNFDVDIKCLPRWDIIESERKMEVGDYSLWHYLIFCKEFISDDCKNDIICWMCEETVLGHPTFKCLECSFVQHKSCTQLPDSTKVNEWHGIKDRHHLILREQTEDDGEKKVLCVACEKLASSPTYRCSIPHCAFHLHKSCVQLSHAILHNAHPNHVLILSLSSSYCCEVCSRDRNRRAALHYHCRICYFHMDYKCSSRWDIIESERKMEVGDCSIWHYLIFCEEFVGDGDVCWVCEELLSGYPSFKCLECDFVQHKSCTQLPNLKYWHHIGNRHHLILQEQTEDDNEKKVVCAGCRKLESHPAYRCSIPRCAFYLHKSCDQLSHVILHNAHRKHTLLLSLPQLHFRCKVCNRRRVKRTTLHYHCHCCFFHMDSICASRWDIIKSERKMKVGDYSIWHYLIFCEELVSDNYKNDIVCWVCEDSISRHPAFKCLECSFVQHETCSQLPNLTEMDVQHDIKDRHHLILREEIENNAKKKVVCAGCREVVSGPTYRCSLLECAFHLHKSCHQPARAIQNIAHPKHTLFLKPSPFSTHCGICGKDRRVETTLLYNCDPCEFKIHYKCAASVKVIKDSDCNPHVLILRQKSIPFMCEACGVEAEEAEDVASQCSKCGVLTHPMCAHFPRTIKIKSHHHLLSRTYCLHRIMKLEKAICKLCCKRVNIKCGAYCCRECDYIVHMRCAELNEGKSTNSSEVEDYTRHLVYLIEGLDEEEDKAVDVPSKINHNNHPQHKLILKSEDFGNDKELHKNSKQCAVCMQFIISSSFYSCEDCNNIFLHKRCAQLPQTVRRPLYGENSFALFSHLLSSTKTLFRCCQCDTSRHGHFYKYGAQMIDVQCFLIPETISHKSHEHLLHIPVLRDPRSKVTCTGCGKEIYLARRYLMCSDCKFWLCFKCATLPLVARYKYHPHLLKLTCKWIDNSEECYCLICEEKLDPKHWFYSCEDCDFPTHIKCLIGGSLKSGRHEHPVILLRGPKHSLRCHLCEKRFGRYDHKVLECPQCKFYFHFQCFY